MHAMNVTVIVTPDGAVELEGVADLPPGKHHALLVVEAPPATTARRRPLQLRSYPVGLISVHDTFRREDLYGDDGR
ncbi:MAG: hypothetical protein M3392_09475 [Actinomycetota bacterium]|nr:hypothetical protein [Actinomycetota bacterium]